MHTRPSSLSLICARPGPLSVSSTGSCRRRPRRTLTLFMSWLAVQLAVHLVGQLVVQLAVQLVVQPAVQQLV